MMKGEVKKIAIVMDRQPSIYANNHPFTLFSFLCSLFSFLLSRSYNENAISLLEQNQDKIDWDNLSSNVAAIILINYLL